MLNKYFKDNVHRHKREKDIDRHLIKEEKKYIKELQQKVEIMERVAQVKLLKKRHRDEEEVKPKIKEETVTDNVEDIDTGFAIEKILKHISKKDKFLRCLNLLENIFISKDNIPSIVVIKVFYYIIKQPHKYSDDASVDSIKSKIYSNLEIHEIISVKKDKYILEEDMNIFSLLELPIKHQINLITDDSFKVKMIYLV
jgi:hypothetical protein